MDTAQNAGWARGSTPALATARLTLRTPVAADAAAIALLANDWDVARRLARLPHPYGIDDARFFLAQIVPNELAWAITARADEALLGIAGLVPHATGVAELGYWLGRPFWGRGLATEAASAIVRYGFEELGLPLLTSGCFVDNRASRRVLTKLGFAETGASTRPCLAEGRDLPFIEMRLDRPSRATVEQP